MELFCKMKLPGALKAKGGISGDSVGNPRTAHLHSHTVGLIVDVIRLAVEVMTMFSKHKADDSKKD